MNALSKALLIAGFGTAVCVGGVFARCAAMRVRSVSYAMSEETAYRMEMQQRAYAAQLEYERRQLRADARRERLQGLAQAREERMQRYEENIAKVRQKNLVKQYDRAQSLDEL